MEPWDQAQNYKISEITESGVIINYHNDISKSKSNGANIKNEINDTSETIKIKNEFANESIKTKLIIIEQIFFVIMKNDYTLPWIVIGLSTHQK